MNALLKKLRDGMRIGIVPFVYMKKDGTIRHAVGTLYGVDNLIKGVKHTACSYTLNYYDVDCKNWRSFIIDNLVSVGDVRKSTPKEYEDICLALVIKLKEKMTKGEKVAFAYRKKDGTIRYAHGIMLHGGGINNGHFTYFDVDKMEKREFIISSFIGFGERGEIDESVAFAFGKTKKSEDSGVFESDKIKSILIKEGIRSCDVESYVVVDLIPELSKDQLKKLIIRATERLATL